MIPVIVWNEATDSIEFRIALADGSGDHVLATVPATPPPATDE